MKTNWLQDFLQIIYPKFCAGCGSDAISSEQPFCILCESKLPQTHFFKMKENPITNIFKGRLSIVNAGSAYYYTNDTAIQALIYAMKYKEDRNMGIYLGKLLGKKLKESDWFSQIDVLVPLPLHKDKEKKRGYNQAELLCQGVAQISPCEIITDAVIRNKATTSQTHKSRTERILAMEDKFELKKPEKLINKHILLIDDLVTTGATLEFCGLEILKAADTQLSIATLGKSMH